MFPSYFRWMRLGRYQRRPRSMPPRDLALMVVAILGMLVCLLAVFE